MEKTKRMIATLVLAVAMIGIVPMPTQAVDPDCNANYTLPSIQPLPRLIAKESSEVGSISISGESDVRVRLPFDGSILAFGVFIVNDNVCEAADVTMDVNCSDHEVVDTDSNSAPQSIDCKLKSPGSQTTFYFHFVNIGDDDLLYQAWEL